MLKRIRAIWHKSRALSALQVYFDQPLKEPLPFSIDAELKRLSSLAMHDGATPIDTALRYFRTLAETTVAENQPLETIDYIGVLGRMFALREKMAFYQEHHEALIAIGKAEGKSI